jgi:predicted HAD superfamily Cof-like phosphohydrolase
MSLSKAMLAVEAFHRAFGQLVGTTPAFPDDATRKLRIKLIEEEFDELVAAEAADDLVEVADALADLVYVIVGTAVSYGIPLDDVFNEVQRSNMQKLWPDGVHTRADGKIEKPPTWTPPSIADVLLKAKIGRCHAAFDKFRAWCSTHNSNYPANRHNVAVIPCVKAEGELNIARADMLIAKYTDRWCSSPEHDAAAVAAAKRVREREAALAAMSPEERDLEIAAWAKRLAEDVAGMDD